MGKGNADWAAGRQSLPQREICVCGGWGGVRWGGGVLNALSGLDAQSIPGSHLSSLVFCQISPWPESPLSPLVPGP